MTRADDYKEVTVAAFAPVSPEQVARNLRITNRDSDELISELIDRAAATVESATGRLLGSRTMQALLTNFPSDDLIINRGPIKSVTKIEYYASGASSLTELPSSQYEVADGDVISGKSFGAIIRFKTTPSVNTDKIYPVVITYTGGCDSASEIHKRLTGAVVLYACEYFLNADNQQQNFGTSQRITSADLLIRPFIVRHF